MINCQLLFKFTPLTLVAVFVLLAFSSCRSATRNRLEEARINSILTYSRAFATDHDGEYPANLADLFPKYISLADNFYSPPQNEAEPELQPYYYRPGLKSTSKVDEPLVVSPHVVSGKVNVGYRGGVIRRMTYEEAQKVLSLPGWLKTAPPIK